MRKSNYILLLLLTSLFFLSSCQKESPEFEKYKLSLQTKVESKVFNFYYRNQEYPVLNTNIVIVPIDTELVNYIIEYKTSRNNLTEVQKKDFRDKIFSKFINGDDAFFAIFCINTGKKENRIYFDQFRKNTVIIDDLHNKFPVKGFTPFLEYDLSLNNVDKGLIRFENFRKYDSNTYSLFLKDLKIYSGYYKATSSHDYILSLDTNHSSLTQLLSDGLEIDEIKEKLKAQQHAESVVLGAIIDAVITSVIEFVVTAVISAL